MALAGQFRRLLLQSRWLAHALPVGLLLLVQVALALNRDLPLITADESVYLAHARYLSGTAPIPTLYEATFFNFGYSLFLLPAFWLFENPHETYTASLIIGAVLMSTVYLTLHYVLVSILGVSSRLASIAAFLTCLYPPVLLRSNFAWAENAYLPGFLLLIAVFGMLLQKKSLRMALVFGLILGFMYTIHPRSLPLIPIAACYLAFLSYYRVLRWSHVAISLSATALILAITRFSIDHLKSLVATGIPENSIQAIISHLLTSQGLLDFLSLVNIQVLQVFQSTLGVFLLGVLAVGYRVFNRRNLSLSNLAVDVPTNTLTFFVIAWLGTLALASAHLAHPNQHEFFLLARFVDGISAPLISLGLVAILDSQHRFPMSQKLALIALVVVSILLALLSLPNFEASPFHPYSGIYPFLAILAIAPALLCAWLAAVFVLFILLLPIQRLRVLAVVAIGIFFIFTSAFNYRFGILPLQDRVAQTSSLAAYIRSYLGSPPAIAYDSAFYHPLTYFTYEYLLTQTRLIPFDSAAGEAPQAPIVISGPRWKDAEILGAQFWQVEPEVTTEGASQALWTLPGSQQTEILKQVDYTNSVLLRPVLPAWGIDTLRGIPVQTVWGVWQRSFYHPDESLVWFDTDAEIHIPLGSSQPRAVLLNFINPATEEKPLQIDVDGQTLFSDAISPGNWCEAFPITGTDSPSIRIGFSRPTREPLFVRGITVLDHVPDSPPRNLTAGPLPATGFRSQVELEEPSIHQVLVRNAMGTVRIRVTNAGDQVWPTSCEIGNNPGAVQLGILWFSASSSERDIAASVAEGRAALPYALAPGESIAFTAILAPIEREGAALPPGEYEVWLGPVQEGVAWFFEHGDDVLKIPVRVIR